MSARGTALIVLAWNQWLLTQRCLDTLLASELDVAEVIVVDNGSTDATVAGLDTYADRVRVIRLRENLGFVRGMNAGIAAARPDDDVVLLNNDLLFTQADWLGRLRDAAYASPVNGIVGCRLLGPEAEGRVYHVGGFIEADELAGQQTEAGTIERDVAQYVSTRRVQHIAFALAYLRRDCLDRIGLLDTAYHSYFEDTDYCLRAAESGIASVVAGAVTLRHDQHGSTQDDNGFRQRLWNDSRATFARRWQRPLADDYRGDLLWQGATRYPYAHAHIARMLVRRLDARGLRMGYEAVEREIGNAGDFRLDLAARRRGPVRPEVSIVCAPALAFTRAKGRHRIGIGFGEWERVPPEWARSANALDRLLVPDAFQSEAFRAAGVTIPIDVFPLGVDREYCHPGVPAPRSSPDHFVFLAVADDLERDAPLVLVDTFLRTFRKDAPASLLLHVQPGRDAVSITQAVVARAAGDPRVRVLSDWGYPWHQRAQLLAAADAYVCARRGGGWDPFVDEALACGKVLVATAFGSHADRVREEGFAVDSVSVSDPRYPGLRWTEPDADALAARLREVFEGRKYLLDRASERADAFATAHDIDNGAERLVDLVTREGRYAAARVVPRRHRPADLARVASGQLVVLGMHRSGTSSVAGLLARMGVSVGPADDLLHGPDNPKGHYESGRVHMACVRRLAATGGDWRDPPSTASGIDVDAFRREMAVLIDGFDTHRPWLIKEPRLCLLAKELLPLLTRPVFVHVVRDPLAVAQSLCARDALDGGFALALWERYTRAAFDASDGWPRVLIDYTQLLADPQAATKRLLDGLQALGVAGLAMPDPHALREWIEPTLDRDGSPMASVQLTRAQRALQASIEDHSILDAVPSPARAATERRQRDAG
ncbi:MAG: glycosyltransferase [Dokdonella sp.]|uniref:glycosyltransferase n=1 Tax=Dokdonella sp. TaxID=2291710 RepID=UPI0032648486